MVALGVRMAVVEGALARGMILVSGEDGLDFDISAVNFLLASLARYQWVGVDAEF